MPAMALPAGLKSLIEKVVPRASHELKTTLPFRYRSARRSTLQGLESTIHSIGRNVTELQGFR
jgi:hypothetical protein